MAAITQQVLLGMGGPYLIDLLVVAGGGGGGATTATAGSSGGGGCGLCDQT